MQVKFASAAFPNMNDGEASIGDKAEAAAVSSLDGATSDPSGRAARRAATRGLFQKHNENRMPMASRFHRRSLPRAMTPKVQRSVSLYRRIISASMWAHRHAGPEIGVKILAGAQLCAGKAVVFAHRAGHHRVMPRAASTLAMQQQEVDFVKLYEDRLHMPVRICAPFASDIARAVPGAWEFAVSVEMPQVPETTRVLRAGAGSGSVVFGGDGGSRKHATTLHDFKDRVKAVRGVVRGY
jgi:hypothetical protein